MKNILIIGAILLAFFSFSSCTTSHYVTTQGGSPKYRGQSYRQPARSYSPYSYRAYGGHGYRIQHGRSSHHGGHH